MEPIDHRLGVFQQRPTGLVVGGPHVHTITQHLVTLLGREQHQARRGCFLVAARQHRQHFGMLWITQIGHDGHVQLVAFLQADLVHADIRDDTLRIDRQCLVIGQLVLHDETHCFGRDAQTPGHFRFVGTDEQAQHQIFEAIGVAGLFAFERRQEIVAMMAFRAAMESGLVAEESRLAEHIEIAHDTHFANVEIGFWTRRFDGLAAWTATRGRQGPRNFDAVRLGQAMIAGDGDAVGQIDVDGEVGHGRPWQSKARPTPCRPCSCV